MLSRQMSATMCAFYLCDYSYIVTLLFFDVFLRFFGGFFSFWNWKWNWNWNTLSLRDIRDNLTGDENSNALQFETGKKIIIIISNQLLIWFFFFKKSGLVYPTPSTSRLLLHSNSIIISTRKLYKILFKVDFL